MRLKNIIHGMNRVNIGLKRSLLESIVAPEVGLALKTWIGSTEIPGVLIGGLALSFYVKPRATMDVDILYLDDKEIPNYIKGFKKTRPHAFQHTETHVEVEIITPTLIGMPMGLAKLIISDSNESNGIKVASIAGLIASKLFSASRQDLADIENLLRYDANIDMTKYSNFLDSSKIDIFKEILQDIN